VKKARVGAQAVKSLPSKLEALSSNSSTISERKEGRRGEGGRKGERERKKEREREREKRKKKKERERKKEKENQRQGSQPATQPHVSTKPSSPHTFSHSILVMS
jgi:hypothetical protein